MITTPNLLPGGTVTRDPLESRLEGGLTGVFRNQRKISFYFAQFLHSEVAWEAQSSILSVKLYMNIRGTTPQGAPPQKHYRASFSLSAR